jgi:hypothetical protein
MKKNPFFIILSIILLFCNVQCKKDDITPIPSNIVLYDKPLKTIQKCIQGKWKLAYAQGGIDNSFKYYCDSCFVEFTSNNKILIPKKDGTYFINTTIEWIRDIGAYTNNEYTYLMKYSDQYGYPNIYVVDGISNDTLIYHDNASDPVFYHYIKTN